MAYHRPRRLCKKSGMVNILLKDGSTRTFDGAVSGSELAAALSSSLAKEAVLCRVNGVLQDLATVLCDGDKVEIIRRSDPVALEVLRHSATHVMAKAVKELFPSAKLAVGPATEDGFFYDFETQTPFTPDDLTRIEDKMRELVAADIAFERLEMTRAEALTLFEKQDEHLKQDLIRNIDAPTVSVYKLGDLYDLCRGPHLPSTLSVGDAFRITKTSGAYWKGDKNSLALQRVYGTVWPSRQELDAFFLRLEEAEKRDHRRLGIDLDLFHMQDLAPGTVFWHTKGWTLYRTLKQFIRSRIEADGYKEVNTPMLVDRILWEKSGHWEKFKENMFITELEDERVMALKPMNCPCHIQIFNQKVVSYKDLPWRMAEFGSCHRYEPSGALHGLMRVRGFVQDDAHIFCTPDQIISETKRFCDLLRGIYQSLGFEQFFVKFSDRPQKRAGSDAIWDLAEHALQEAATAAGLDYALNPGEGAFYGPKLEFVLKDCLGREWQCGTLQVDFVLPERLDAWYVTETGEKKHPVMLHRAVLGSMERFIGILIEHHAGNFPGWLAPIQAVVATITDDAAGAADSLLGLLHENGIRATADLRNEKISYKIREHAVQKIPFVLILGKKEVEQGTATIRRFGSEEQVTLPHAEVVARLVAACRLP